MDIEKKQKNTHGGARKGAGRKKIIESILQIK